VTGVSVNGAAAISPDSNGIVPLTDIGSAATIASQAKTIAAQATTIANLQSQIDKYKPHWWAWVTCSHEVNIKINGTTITLPEGRSKIEDFESVVYDASDMDKFLDGITGFDIYSTGSIPLSAIRLGYLSGNLGISVPKLDATHIDTSRVTSLEETFALSSLAAIEGLAYWDVSNVTTLHRLFTRCAKLTSVDGIEYWDTSKCTNMDSIFSSCKSLTELDLSLWDVSNVTSGQQMFNSCSNLKEVNLSSWDTTNMKSQQYYMFTGCSQLENLNIAKWSTQNGTNFSSFFSCPRLSNLIVGENFGTAMTSVTIDLSSLNQYGNKTYSAYVLSDESWASFKTMYDREENGLPTMTIKFSAKHKANYADWDSFVEYMTARGYNITTA
jgi:surface protein